MTLAELLPRFTLITGPSGAGKTTLANLLFDEVPGLQAHSFAAPLRDVARALLFDNNITVDLTQPDMKRLVPLTATHSRTVRDFLNGFGDWLRVFYGEDIIGVLAKKFVEEQIDYFEHFVFDDYRRWTDIESIEMEVNDAKQFLVIALSRPGIADDSAFRNDEWDTLTKQFPRVVHLSNDRRPVDMLSTLATLLTPKALV